MGFIVRCGAVELLPFHVIPFAVQLLQGWDFFLEQRVDVLSVLLA